jgi:hypothetical protein
MGQVGRRSNEDKDRLMASIKNLLLQGVPVDEIAVVVDLRPDTVRRHITTIRKQWIDEGIGSAESKLELIERANLIAKLASSGHRAVKGKSISGEAAFLKIQLEVLDRLAKLTGAFEAQKTEVSGPNGGPVQMQLSEHPVDKLSGQDLAKRLRNWAEALEEEPDGQPDVPTVVEGTSKDV